MHIEKCSTFIESNKSILMCVCVWQSLKEVLTNWFPFGFCIELKIKMIGYLDPSIKTLSMWNFRSGYFTIVKCGGKSVRTVSHHTEDECMSVYAEMDAAVATFAPSSTFLLFCYGFHFVSMQCHPWYMVHGLWHTKHWYGYPDDGSSLQHRSSLRRSIWYQIYISLEWNGWKTNDFIIGQLKEWHAWSIAIHSTYAGMIVTAAASTYQNPKIAINSSASKRKAI